MDTPIKQNALPNQNTMEFRQITLNDQSSFTGKFIASINIQHAEMGRQLYLLWTHLRCQWKPVRICVCDFFWRKVSVFHSHTTMNKKSRQHSHQTTEKSTEKERVGGRKRLGCYLICMTQEKLIIWIPWLGGHVILSIQQLDHQELGVQVHFDNGPRWEMNCKPNFSRG